ncbi:UDP-2,3-diacylglucosamine hydrolase [beta proteobacterium AAP121]|nr:UDP-2,3-diacylglucosamine hydrolase [beta proteobacterium AAP65]KPF96587.1 UDP-2,3-diacylglucosamine hydrolase [beta proteobacterium AAP121]
MDEAARNSTFPPFYELAAPPAWRAVDFISDLHLCAAMPATFEAWAQHLRHTTADAVFILGDLFEVWVGDDARHGAFERACVDVLAEAASHRLVAFMAGNRDFLVGPALLQEAGLMALPDPTVLQAWGQPVLLTHGDALCLSDQPYQAFREQVRGAAWQLDFLARPLAERLALAAEMRRASAARWQMDGDASADVDAAEAVRWMHALGAAEMVHGHTHRPGSGALAPGYKRHVLSDWDLDGGTPRAEVLRLSRRGFERLPPVGR